MGMRRANRITGLGAAALAALLAAGCGAGPAGLPSPDAGVRAIEADRALTDPDAESASGDNTGTWGGVQMPNIQDAPRLPLPPSRVPGL
jgi:hypothetical protein